MVKYLSDLRFHKPLGLLGSHFAHSDCDTVCNLLRLFAILLCCMTMSIDCAIVSLSVAQINLFPT